MADTPKKLAQMTLTGGNDTLYTVPAATSALIKHIRVVNFSGADKTVKLWHDGTTDANIILPAVNVVAGGWGEFDGAILMETGDTLVALGSAASGITVTVYGVELT